MKCLYLKILSVFFLTCFIISCGLEENIPYLNPPYFLLRSPGSQYFQIKIKDDNDEEYFRGVEFYYKFYHETDTNLEINLDTHDDLTAANFKRLSSSTDSINNYSKPLVFVPLADRGFESEITLDFSDIDDPYLYADPAGVPGLDIPIIPHFELYRESTYIGGPNNNKCKPFNDMLTTDSDLSDITQTLSYGDTLTLLLYAISYGKYDLTTKLYSKAVYLQYITILYTE